MDILTFLFIYYIGSMIYSYSFDFSKGGNISWQEKQYCNI